ncbi:CheR family methyltransferase [Uliginosibacterium paludis]|uniref:CheR family methyltransferase n=1 Tax=Uliginosibacterium paludis TaxID=1615952 RepID=UPI0031F66B4C
MSMAQVIGLLPDHDLLKVEREFDYTEADFEEVRRLIYERAGISLSTSKQDLVYGRLARRLRALRVPSFAAYLAVLQRPESEEWEHFTNALTTNLTAFFRERHHFEMLAAELRAHAGERAMRIWSAASSTGEEPWSIAITVAETLRRATDEVRILATDIDSKVIEHGRAGVYAIERVDALDDALRRRYFQRGSGPHAGKVRIVPGLRSMVSFRRLNLLDEAWPMRHRFDAVFLRNVLIYFDKATQAHLLSHLANVIEPGGVLFLGHSESPPMDRQVFTPIGRTAYRVGGRRHG